MASEQALVLNSADPYLINVPAFRLSNVGVLVAKTCKHCGELLAADRFRPVGRGGSPDSSCEDCRRRDVIDRTSGHQDATRAQAKRRGQQWTGVELEIALRDDLTAHQAAAMIGRTMYSVQSMRKKHKRDVKIQLLAGL